MNIPNPFRRLPEPVLKWGDDSGTEPDELVEINEYHDVERKFRRAGDRHAALISGHHCNEVKRSYMEKTGNIVTYDVRRDRWQIWKG